ncbi:NADH dehydrogenase [ubiquinone] 1 alpha subcomplex subunit 9, mitochondrial [Nymphon striatum]|nr:NADH dehydrogenase [ubiquinone] 1 alpha subcomplex subunit 9, mitochondrial [Nymphon striatum]
MAKASDFNRYIKETPLSILIALYSDKYIVYDTKHVRKKKQPSHALSNYGWLGIPSSNKLQSNQYSTSGLAARKALKSLDITQIKKGTGGRSSFSGIIATVFGSSGFLGRYVINRLGRIGSQIIVPYRGDEYSVQRLKLSGDLGQILFLPYDLKNEESLYKAMRYSNVVINTIGREYETKKWKFSDVHINGPRNIARIAKECGVEKLIHVSAFNCDENPKPVILKNGSQFLRSKVICFELSFGCRAVYLHVQGNFAVNISQYDGRHGYEQPGEAELAYHIKWYGEEAIMDEFPTATIIRPSDMFGMEDRFLRHYCHPARTGGILETKIPLWNKGRNVIKQPVYVGDVAEGIINCIFDEDTFGQIYEAVGPKRYQLPDLIDYMYRFLQLESVYHISNMKYDPAFRLRVTLAEKILKYSYLSWERMEREHMSDTLASKPGLEDLGVTLTNLEDRAHFVLKTFLRRVVLPFNEVAPPPVANC